MKLQINVTDAFVESLDTAVQAALLERNPGQRPPKLSNLIPTALLDYAERIGAVVSEELRVEANEVLTRKPGPRAKKPLESHDLFDDRPGTWLSTVAIATGCAVVFCGEQSLSLSECTHIETAALKAVNVGWGAIPESRQVSNDPTQPGLPGLRFIPPGVDFAPTPKAPPPMTLADVGVWISEESILTRSALVLADARVVNNNPAVAIPENAFVIPCAVLPGKAQYLPDWTEAQQKIHDAAYEEAKKRAVFESVMFAQIEAYELGWTMRREIRKGKPGILLVPPKVRLTYEIAHGQTVPVSQ